MYTKYIKNATKAKNIKLAIGLSTNMQIINNGIDVALFDL